MIDMTAAQEFHKTLNKIHIREMTQLYLLIALAKTKLAKPKPKTAWPSYIA